MTEYTKDRLGFFDALRGLTMISMALFHGAYDLAYLYGLPMPWFTEGIFQDTWRASISWVFLFIAGWMCTLSHNNFTRARKYAAVAVIVWLATTIASVDDSINFGIIYCMAACTFVVAVTKPIVDKLPPRLTFCMLLLLFFITRSIPHHTYVIIGMAWLGFPDADFISGDYYPLVPFIFMYLAGYMAARIVSNTCSGYPDWMYDHPLPLLEALGRHALVFYLLHQPVILIVLDLIYSVR